MVALEGETGLGTWLAAADSSLRAQLTGAFLEIGDSRRPAPESEKHHLLPAWRAQMAQDSESAASRPRAISFPFCLGCEAGLGTRDQGGVKIKVGSS